MNNTTDAYFELFLNLLMTLQLFVLVCLYFYSFVYGVS